MQLISLHLGQTANMHFVEYLKIRNNMQIRNILLKGDNSMEPIPHDIPAQFNAVLAQKAVPSASHDDYRKWLRYFLDYRLKYPPPAQRTEQVRLFIPVVLAWQGG